jgi:hypothetical protein
MSFGWTKDDVIESVFAAGSENKQVVTEITLSLAGFLDK